MVPVDSFCVCGPRDGLIRSLSTSAVVDALVGKRELEEKEEVGNVCVLRFSLLVAATEEDCVGVGMGVRPAVEENRGISGDLAKLKSTAPVIVAVVLVGG